MTAPRLGSPTQAKLITRLLQYGEPISKVKLAELLGLSTRNLREHMKILHDIRFVHIADWVPNAAGEPTPRYWLGDAPDAPRPAPVEGAARSAAYREANRDIINERKRANRMRAKTADMSMVATLLYGGIHGNDRVSKERVSKAAD